MIGEAAVETLYLNGYLHRTFPLFGSHETYPFCVRKITCCCPRIVPIVGVACVIASLSPFQTVLPELLSIPSSDSFGPPQAAKIKSPSITGEAAFCQLMTLPLCSATRSFVHLFSPVFASKQ